MYICNALEMLEYILDVFEFLNRFFFFFKIKKISAENVQSGANENLMFIVKYIYLLSLGNPNL